MSRLTAAQIREKFPNPICIYDFKHLAKVNQYCVGGALCLYLNEEFSDRPFPWIKSLSGALLKANHRLTVPVAKSYANQIIQENDRAENFEEAWKILDLALSFGYEK